MMSHDVVMVENLILDATFLDRTRRRVAESAWIIDEKQTADEKGTQALASSRRFSCQTHHDEALSGDSLVDTPCGLRLGTESTDNGGGKRCAAISPGSGHLRHVSARTNASIIQACGCDFG
jgi:hypothetical protein